jgi:N-acyl-D-amino-acid deacylase
MICIAHQTPDAVGKTYHEYAVEHGMTDVQAYAYIIRKNGSVGQDIRFLMSDEDLAMLYAHPLCMVGTDGLYSGVQTCTHPRGLATFPRYLGRFIREQKVLSLEEGVRRVSGLIADTFRLTGKGYIKEGFDADLVLFNKDTIIDQATYADPFLPNIGIEMVFVSGQAAVVNNKPTGVFNGKVYKPAK